jgi:hypothetical protein
LLQRAFTRARANPWFDVELVRRALEVGIALAQAHPESAVPLYETLKVPFVAGQLDQVRKTALLTIASPVETCGPRTIAALRAFEPHPPWSHDHLSQRAYCYEKAGLNDLFRKAQAEYQEFVRAEPEPLER